MSTLMIDYETFSLADVREVGSFVYANHPSTRVILISVRDPDWPRSLVFEESNIWLLLNKMKKAGQIHWTKNEPLDLIHWSPFDLHITQYATPLLTDADDCRWDADHTVGAIKGPHNTYWSDLSDLSLIYGGPAKLSHAAAFWGNTELKDEGKHLISRFCSPQPNGSIFDKASDPIRWEQFRAYAGQDTNVMVPILDRFLHLAENGGEDLARHWPALRCVGRMNERGVPIDVDSARVAYESLHAASERVSVECEEEYGFKPTNVAKIKAYLGTEDCQKETLEAFVAAGEGTLGQIILAETRLQTSGAATKKLTPMLRRSRVDNRAHDCFRYNGAWTRRLTSSGVQFQNMLRAPSSEEFFRDLLSNWYDDEAHDIFAEVRQNIRGFVKAVPNTIFVAADYSQIELRVGAWLAGEDWLTKLFVAGDDPYLRMATNLYGTPVTSKTDKRRQFGKIVELAALFGLGRHGLRNQAGPQGVELTEREAQRAIDTYRRTHPAVVQCWADCQAAFELAMRGEDSMVGAIGFESLESAVKVVRPSGFAQYYWVPRFTQSTWPDGGAKTDISYEGRIMSGAMGTKTTYGGDIFQGVVQGTAADLMLEGMLNGELAGFPPVMSVHDEIVCEIPDTGIDYGDELCAVFNVLPTWAKGLPVVSEAWQSVRFTK